MRPNKLSAIAALALVAVIISPAAADSRTINAGRIAEYTAPGQVAAAVGGRWDLDRIQAYQAWAALSPDKAVLVAVLDTGIDTAHPDLNGRVVDAVNFSRSETTNDANGHGTYLAGIIAAAANGGGAPGLAFNASLLNVKVAGDDG